MTERAPVARPVSARVLPPPGSQDSFSGLMKLARLMPENGGKGSLDYELRAMLARDFRTRLLWQHNSDSRRAHEGWPDWTIARKVRAGQPGAVLYRELKREGKNPTPAQQEWLDALLAVGQDAATWRPSDYYSGRIARELAALAGLKVAGGDQG